MKYQIRFKNNKVLKHWNILTENMPEAIEKCRSFLENSPMDRAKSNGKLKKLKGEYEGLLQYDLTDNARVRYTVDTNDHNVYVEYAGGHP